MSPTIEAAAAGQLLVGPTIACKKRDAIAFQAGMDGKVLLAVILRHTCIAERLDIEVADQNRLVKPHRFGSVAVEVEIRVECCAHGAGEYSGEGGG